MTEQSQIIVSDNFIDTVTTYFKDLLREESSLYKYTIVSQTQAIKGGKIKIDIVLAFLQPPHKLMKEKCYLKQKNNTKIYR